MKKKLLVLVIALLLIGSVLGGLWYWNQKKGQSGGETPDADNGKVTGPGKKITDKDGNTFEMAGPSPVYPQYGNTVLVNGKENGILREMQIGPDGYATGSNGGASYTFKNGNWIQR